MTCSFPEVGEVTSTVGVGGITVSAKVGSAVGFKVAYGIVRRRVGEGTSTIGEVGMAVIRMSGGLDLELDGRED